MKHSAQRTFSLYTGVSYHHHHRRRRRCGCRCCCIVQYAIHNLKQSRIRQCNLKYHMHTRTEYVSYNLYIQSLLVLYCRCAMCSCCWQTNISVCVHRHISLLMYTCASHAWHVWYLYPQYIYLLAALLCWRDRAL